MGSITYEDLANRLTTEAMALFRQMVAVHLASSGDRMFIRAGPYLGRRGIDLHFTGGGADRNLSGLDGGALDDLAGYGLLQLGHSSRGTPNYRVGSEALAFHRWLMDREGSAMAQVDQEVRRVVSGDAFAAAHPGAAHHLREAFELLWSGRNNDQVVSEIGDHLRKALMDTTNDVVDDAGGQERPVQRLEAHIADSALGDREGKVIIQVVELVRTTLRLDHRLNHIRDENDLGEPPATWEEMRRAAFATALACYELDRLR